MSLSQLMPIMPSIEDVHDQEISNNAEEREEEEELVTTELLHDNTCNDGKLNNSDSSNLNSTTPTIANDANTNETGSDQENTFARDDDNEPMSVFEEENDSSATRKRRRTMLEVMQEKIETLGKRRRSYRNLHE